MKIVNLKIVKILNSAIILFNCLILYSCCIEKDYNASLNRYIVAKDILFENKKKLSKYSASSKGGLIIINKSQLKLIQEQENIKQLDSILLLWDDGLLCDKDNALKIFKNGDVEFLVHVCKKKQDILIYSTEGINMFQTDETSFDKLNAKDWYLRVDRDRD